MRDGDLGRFAVVAAAARSQKPQQHFVEYGRWTFDDCNDWFASLADTALVGNRAYRTLSVRCVPGVAAQGVALARRGDLVYVPDEPFFTFEQGVTVAGWIRPTDLHGTRTLFRKRDEGLSSFALVLRNGRLQFVVNLGDGHAAAVIAPDRATVGVFQHVAATYDGSTLRLYVDGAEVAARGASGEIPPGPGPFLMGNDGDERRFDGVLDEVRFVGRALSAAEVQGLTCARANPSAVITPAISAPTGAFQVASFDVALTNGSGGACPPTPIRLVPYQLYSDIVLTPEPGVGVETTPLANGETAHVTVTAMPTTTPPGLYTLYYNVVLEDPVAPSVSTAWATLVVEAICERRAPAVTVTPPRSPPMLPPATTIYEVAVTNVESPACAPASFAFAWGAPPADITVMPSEPFAVGPLGSGETAFFQVSASAPETIPLGLYALPYTVAAVDAPELVTAGAAELHLAEPIPVPLSLDGVYAAPFNSSAVELADLDGDGKLDVVVATSAGVGVLLGNGDGTLRPAVNYAAGPMTHDALAVGDLDGDGVPDLVVTGQGSATPVAVLLGNGDGSFRDPVGYQTEGVFSPGVAIVDLDRDGVRDLVVTNFLQSSISVLRGSGDGTFGPPATYATNGNAYDVAAGDLNGDGLPEVVVTTYGPATQMFIATGDGTLQPPFDLDDTPSGGRVALGDVNHDGILDIVAAGCCGRGTVTVFLWTYSSGFASMQLLPTGINDLVVKLGDVTGDGHLDAVAVGEPVTEGGPDIAVLAGFGDGLFQMPINLSADRMAFGAAIGDLDGDGRGDLVVSENQSDTRAVWVFMNRP